MKERDYTPLLKELSEAYTKHAPRCAAIHEKAVRYLVDGGSNALRTIQPFPPRIASAQGAYVIDEDGNRILDFWQGHYGNILGHNPPVVTEALAKAFADGFGLQTGFTDQLQVEVAEILCRQTGSEQIRFTTSGTLATMYAMMLAKAHTGRNLFMKVGGGWHGGHLWGLKGVGYHEGFKEPDSAGLPASVVKEVVITQFNNPEQLKKDFRKYGDKLACFILEPVIGAGGLMPAQREYIQLARHLTEQYGVILIFDEVISAFRYRAGNVAALYRVQPDLMTLGKAIGGGMPVAAVAGRADLLKLAGSEYGGKVKFQGGTYAAHPAAMLAARVFLKYLIENESKIYPRLAEIGAKTRQAVTRAFTEEGIYVRFAGDCVDALPGTSLHMLLFPYQEGLELCTPEEVRNPHICDITLSEKVLQLALLLENVFTIHGLGCSTVAHTDADIQFLENACRNAARRIKPYL